VDREHHWPVRHTPGKLKRFGEAEGLSDPRVRVLHLTDDGHLLLGTQAGLFEVKPGEDRVQRAGITQGLPQHLDFTAIHQLPGEEILAGTLSTQLYHFDGVRWLAIGREQGLPVNSPFFITHDSQGWVWVAGIRGVYRVLLSELQALHRGEEKTLDIAHMLLSERGDQRGSQKGYCCDGAGNAKGFTEDDLLWLPTRGGVVTLGSKDVVMNVLPPPVIIERVRHSGTWHQVLDAGDLAIPRGARDLAFEFRGRTAAPHDVNRFKHPLFTEYDGAPNGERMVELADLAPYAVKSSIRNGWATFRATAPMRLDTLIEDLKRDTAATLASGRAVLHRSPPAA